MTDDPIVIRRGAEHDVPILAKHRVAMFRDMGSVSPSAETALLEAASFHIREAMAADEYIAWVAEIAGESPRVVAGSGMQLRRLLPRPDHDGQQILIGREGIILNMYVEADHRRRGLARRLLEHMIAFAPSTDIVRLVLHASDEGRALYESMGFVQTNEMRYTRPLR